MGVRREFRTVALSTQEMAPDATFLLFSIPGNFGAKDGGNMLLLSVIGYFVVTGIIFALLCRIWELVWMRVTLPGPHRWAVAGHPSRSHSRSRE